MITRFAPSPTGPLHLGHAFSAMLAHDMAQSAGGTFLLRIEDIDQSRARPEWEAQIHDDLHWLGLTWPEPVMRQSSRSAAYGAALDVLWAAGLLYACTCNRRDIFDAAAAPQEGAPLLGPDGIVYPGTCRPAGPPSGPRPCHHTLRLNMATAIRHGPAATGTYQETDGLGPARTIAVDFSTLPRTAGDVVLARKTMDAAYHLAVVVDDAAQAITDVVRGADLSDATPIHILLQSLLGRATPTYHHHRLIRDQTGRRLAKRDDARAIGVYRHAGATPADIRRMVGL